MSAKKIVIQQKLERSEEYQELWPKTDCYTKTETDSIAQDIRASVQSLMQTADWQIGDIRGTVKNDLSNNWLLCDGSTRNGNDYPVLLQYLGSSGETFVNLGQIGTYSLPTDITYSKGWIVKVNNIYVIGGTESSTNAKIAYSSDLNSWTEVTVLKGSTFLRMYKVYKIKYVNGYYFAGVWESSSNEYTYISSDLNTWTMAKYGNSAPLRYMDVQYYNGVWYLADGSQKLFYSSNPLSGFSYYSYSNYVYSLLRYNDIWAILAYKEETSDKYYSINILTGTDLNGSLSTTLLNYQTVGYSTSRYKVIHLARTNSQWVLCREDSDTDSLYHWYFSNNAAISADMFNSSSITSDTDVFESFGNQVLLPTVTITSSQSTVRDANEYYLAKENATTFLSFSRGANTGTVTRWQVYIDTITLPTIASAGKVNYYIKAKESD